ncbi:MAG TPA: LacI family DNA-binding transcriptional regulator [Actinomycetota bacterium]|nr:LacI family DNA-binding transcriptional regulator [Actinomycetota bacterium]
MSGGSATPTPRGSRRRHPTIIDVAERAGVSKSLVSLVMRGAPNVSDEKREAVTRAAAEIGYRPNAVARSLVRNRSFVIGVMVSDLHNPYFTEVIDGIEEAARSAGYHALFNTGGRTEAGESEAIDTLLQLRTDGVVMAGPVLAPRRIAAVAATVPVVVVARHSRSPAHDSITNDDRLGARIAVDHLVSLGHRRIAHVDGGTGAGAPQRRGGYLAAMERHGLGSSARVVPGAFTEEGGRDGVTELLRSRDGVTAIFVGNDLAAVGALGALDHHGLRVPEDVSLVGYDNIALAGLGHIDLTSIDQPRRDMGVTAVRLLLERRDEDRRTARHLVAAPSLVVRGSTGPPRSRAG